MAQVQGVGHQLARRQRVDLAGDRQFGQAELLYLRSPLAADLHQPVLARPDPAASRSQLGVGGVEVGPVGRQRQVASLRDPTLDQRVLDRGQRGGGIEI